MDIEDVSGWDDDVFLKGKKDRVSFGACLYKLNENLDAFLEDDIDFYKENLLKLMREFDNLPKQIDYVTWYNL